MGDESPWSNELKRKFSSFIRNSPSNRQSNGRFGVPRFDHPIWDVVEPSDLMSPEDIASVSTPSQRRRKTGQKRSDKGEKELSMRHEPEREQQHEVGKTVRGETEQEVNVESDQELFKTSSRRKRRGSQSGEGTQAAKRITYERGASEGSRKSKSATHPSTRRGTRGRPINVDPSAEAFNSSDDDLDRPAYDHDQYNEPVARKQRAQKASCERRIAEPRQARLTDLGQSSAITKFKSIERRGTKLSDDSLDPQSSKFDCESPNVVDVGSDAKAKGEENGTGLGEKSPEEHKATHKTSQGRLSLGQAMTRFREAGKKGSKN